MWENPIKADFHRKPRTTTLEHRVRGFGAALGTIPNGTFEKRKICFGSPFWRVSVHAG